MTTESLEMMEALLLVLTDKEIQTSAIFIHGSSVRSDELDKKSIELAAQLFLQHRRGGVLINGSCSAECEKSNIAYRGKESIVDLLTQQCEVNTDQILLTPTALHTAAECFAVIDIAKERGWQSITLVAFPHHILRCMLQMVYCIQDRKSRLKVYPQTFEPNWAMTATKPVMGGGVVNGTLFDHIAAEFTRIEKYMDKGGQGYTPHATLGELISYMRGRA